jgi:DNA helicase-2/ATP-dependent DNA helicase PcrA
VDLLGSGDFTHPAWVAELEEKLVETGDGAYELRPELASALTPQVPGACRRPVRFLLSGEISSIYKRQGKTRKVHSLILLPDLEAVKRLNQRLDLLGNIQSDGRPILGLDAHDLLELCLEVEPGVIFIPAHIWTPWFSLFGSKSGFDSIEECFADLTGHIHALETGLSSDPSMNWRLSALDGYKLVSHSDAHSPGKLAREADLFTCPPTYPDIAAALSGSGGDGLAGTLEFFPDEGKYHLDGHRKCGVRLDPAQTRELGGKCPVCGGNLTVGVLSRVEDLADRPPGDRPSGALPFESLVPLPELMSEVMQRGPATKGVTAAVDRLVQELGPELYILRQAPLDQLKGLGGEVLAEGVRRMRQGKVYVEGGFDGQFGIVRLFSPSEREELKGQKAFFNLKPKPRTAKTGPAAASPRKRAPAPELETLSLLDPAREGLNPRQQEAVEHRGRPLIVQAGPGTGKTRVLVQRAVALLEEGIEPEAILMITFTRKAAAEMAQRLARQKPSASGVQVSTFHSLGKSILTQARGSEPRVLGQEERLSLIALLAKEAGMAASELSERLSLLKQVMEPPSDPAFFPLFAQYEAALAQEDALDMDDLVRRAADFVTEDQDLARHWQNRFAQVMVDEYQDVNQAQVALLQGIVGPKTQVTAIGDPDQAIYGFRGADSRYFQDFARDFSGASQMGLEMNYRSTASILAAAQSLIQAASDSARVLLKPARDGGPRPELCTLPSPRAEAAWVAAKVVDLLGGLDSRQVEADPGTPEEGYGARDIAVLYRLHALAGPLREALNQAGVPVQVAAREPLAETDPLDFKAQRVSLLSMHAAKGLEFTVVFLAGLEEGILPYLPPNRPPADPDEERRLLYVAMTRAKERLFMTHSRTRTLFGRSRRPSASPFLKEIAPGLLVLVKPPPQKRTAKQLDLF